MAAMFATKFNKKLCVCVFLLAKHKTKTKIRECFARTEERTKERRRGRRKAEEQRQSRSGRVVVVAVLRLGKHLQQLKTDHHHHHHQNSRQTEALEGRKEKKNVDDWARKAAFAAVANGHH